MANFVLTNAGAYVDGYDLSGESNKLTLTAEAETRDSTTFGSSGYRSRRGGLRTVALSAAGYFEALLDTNTVPNLGTADRAVTVTPTADTGGSIAYMFQAGRFGYEVFGQVGDMTPFSLNVWGTNTVGLVRGQLIRARGDVSATGGGTAQQVGAGGAGKFLYATLHVFTAGTTITVQVQSDNAQAFSSPTTVATIGPITTTGGTWLTRVDAAAITDNWWRLNVSAITGTFNVAGAVAVQ